MACRILVGVLLLAASVAQAAPTVTFLNPGHADPANASGPFWRMVGEFAQAAARDLGIELETLYADRNHLRMIEQARDVLERETRPDYLLIVNEKRAAGPILDLARGSGTRVMLIMNDLLPDQKAELGEPRGRIRNWIGTLLPDNRYAGYQIARQTLKQARDLGLAKPGEPLRVVAIAGDEATYASIERVRGLERAIAEAGDAVLEQVSMAHWREDRARQVAAGMLRRYPDADVIWAANDPMAYGAMTAARALGRVPGESLAVGGLNLEREALDHVREGRMAVSVGGHFMTAGWALVMLSDYHAGLDFKGLEASVGESIFGYVTRENLDRYIARLGDQNWERLDFRAMTRQATGDAGYRLGLGVLLSGDP